jgi:hypothetical protein
MVLWEGVASKAPCTLTLRGRERWGEEQDEQEREEDITEETL